MKYYTKRRSENENLSPKRKRFKAGNKKRNKKETNNNDNNSDFAIKKTNGKITKVIHHGVEIRNKPWWGDNAKYCRAQEMIRSVSRDWIRAHRLIFAERINKATGLRFTSYDSFIKVIKNHLSSCYFLQAKRRLKKYGGSTSELVNVDGLTAKEFFDDKDYEWYKRIGGLESLEAELGQNRVSKTNQQKKSKKDGSKKKPSKKSEIYGKRQRKSCPEFNDIIDDYCSSGGSNYDDDSGSLHIDDGIDDEDISTFLNSEDDASELLSVDLDQDFDMDDDKNDDKNDDMRSEGNSDLDAVQDIWLNYRRDQNDKNDKKEQELMMEEECRRIAKINAIEKCPPWLAGTIPGVDKDYHLKSLLRIDLTDNLDLISKILLRFLSKNGKLNEEIESKLKDSKNKYVSEKVAEILQDALNITLDQYLSKYQQDTLREYKGIITKVERYEMFVQRFYDTFLIDLVGNNFGNFNHCEINVMDENSFPPPPTLSS